MSKLSQECQLTLKSMKFDGVEQVEVLRQRKGHTVYRISAKSGSFVLKCFQSQVTAKEIQVYRLLQEHGVPTLPCHGIADNAILLEDLDFSKVWHRAYGSEMGLSSTGKAVADWYRTLHDVGFKVVGRFEGISEYLQSWIDIINESVLEEIGMALDVVSMRGWELALANCEKLKQKYRSFPQTFNYNDFAEENLALSEIRGSKQQAIVYDYDQFSVGTVYSDWRNVTYSLQGRAREAFIATYGEVSESEYRIDDVLSILHGLIVAVERDKFPEWALPLHNSIGNGELEQKIQSALEIV